MANLELAKIEKLVSAYKENKNSFVAEAVTVVEVIQIMKIVCSLVMIACPIIQKLPLNAKLLPDIAPGDCPGKGCS